jgi:hypothetical protein
MKWLGNLDLITNELQNAVIQPLASAPSTAKVGQIYYNTTDLKLYQYNGTAWVCVGVTYSHAFGTASSNSVPLILTGSDGSTSTVNITGAGGATLSMSGSTLTITTADNNTTYTFTGTVSATNYIITITPSTGTAQTVTIPLATASAAGLVVVDNTMSSTSTNPVQNKIIKAYVDAIISANNGIVYKGTVNSSTDIPTTYNTGWLYVVGTAGTYVGQTCEIGDMIIALVSRTGSGNLNSDWDVIQTNINGAITSLTGTTPITITGTGASRTISHANSGVTAGTYGGVSGGVITIPTITVNAMGHVTTVTTVTQSVPLTVTLTLTAGQTTVTNTSTAFSKVIGVVAKDATTNEQLIVDGVFNPSTPSMSFTIAQTYANNITINVTYLS